MTLNLQTPFPTFGGSTGGWLRAAEVEEKYAITWTSKKEQIFEMPTGGAAIMRNGENLLYLASEKPHRKNLHGQGCQLSLRHTPGHCECSSFVWRDFLW